ncbi:pentatricopeptide repeat-containing protein [Panicum miliaceum]|uniref:Pentatricopeptide repeat-containing protein n=1 Tax=Panicum miliaceum TaxID=4540 RepID=A0A3L6PA60_PANMI|nr:pentatricopeptide repeat-containing protein [Panicum miliaceum]
MSSAGLARTLKSLCITGDLSKAVRLLCQSPLCPGARTYTLLLQECVNRRDARLGKRIHARMVATGFRCGEYITTKLLIFYAKIGDLGCAQKLFDGMPQRSVVAWNSTISGCARGGAGEQERAVELFGAMRAEGLAPDQFTFASVLCACARLAALPRARRRGQVGRGRERVRQQRARGHVPQVQQPRGRAPGVRGGAGAERHHVDRGHLRARPAGARRLGAGALRPDGGGRVPAQRRDVPRRALGLRARRARRRGAEAVRVHVVGLRARPEGPALRGGGRHACQGRETT